LTKKLSWIALSIILVFSAILFSQSQRYLKVSVADSSRSLTRVLIESSSPIIKTFEKDGDKLHVKIRSFSSLVLQKKAFTSRFVRSVAWSQDRGFYVLTVKSLHGNFTYDTYAIEDPPQLFINIRPQGEFERESTGQAEQSSSTGGNESVSPMAREKMTIIIDPGHGGMESGAKGKFGTLEKDITLDIAKKLKTIVEKNLAFNVVLTRDKDVEVALDSRAAIANNNRAFLFISIHANSSFRKKAHGSETFFLSLNATDEEARRLAYLENNSEVFGGDINPEETDDIQMILWDMAQAAYLKQSSELAEYIQQELNSLLGTRNRGVKQAPFKVLTGVACPAVLVEVAFISNPEEERKLLSVQFQNNVAQALYRGLIRFIRKFS